ncbi:phage tail protein [Paenibacillus rigui]|uniref:Phage tail protein n=1 Tax=Paenibacillus rigui TaxID=554312 RepID=A0A229UTJ6_9BACL|nr:tail fiber protein [Paenibacillus rigui]OXM86653.1 phage tail protein [Paenibacillus rigui]
MAEPFLGEIRLFPINFAPKGWIPCNGQLLAIQQNQALFSILGITYGGDGRVTFAVPNLQGRTPVQVSPTTPLGQMAGEESHTLTINEMPQHTHQVVGGSNSTAATPTGNVWGTSTSVTPYEATANTTMSANAVAAAGSSQPHGNMQPYTVLNFCIAVTGVYPPRN